MRNLENCPVNTIPLTYMCTLCIIFMITALIVFPLQLLSHDKNFVDHPVYLDMPYATLFQNQFHVNQCQRNIEISIY